MGSTPVAAPLPAVPSPPADRMCRAECLSNPLRRLFAPARRSLAPLGLRPGEMVADLGTGVGYLVPEILKETAPTGRVFAVDIDVENLEILRRRVAALGETARVTTIVSSAARVAQIPSGSVDCVLLSLVLCCLADKAGALDEAWRILRPGGRALVTYPRLGGSPYRRKRSLRVTREVWEALRVRHAWSERHVAHGPFVRAHLLSKP